jgi:hypothetical protein
MSVKAIYTKWKKFVSDMNDKGIPLPMVRDPNSLEGSVSLTLVVMSSMLVVAGIVGKWAGFLGIDMASAFNFFYASTTLYFGHSWVNKEPKEPRRKEPEEDPKPQKLPKADDPDS